MNQAEKRNENSYKDLLKNSILKIQEKDQRIQELESGRDKPIAVIGLSCRFPGASNPEAFRQLVKDGNDAITTMTNQRWDMDDFFSPLVGEPGKISTRHFGLLDTVDQFDPSAFGISEDEAPYLDPQHRLLLEQAWYCFERAGLDIADIRGSDIGVFIGQMNNDYTRLINSPLDLNAYVGQGNALSAASGRLSYVFGLNGPSISVDTACSSSLVTVHLACQSLRMGECSAALAGGVNLLLSPEAAIGTSVAHMLSVRGRCNAFGDSADGYVRSEGCGLVLLKTLDQAEKDGDKILAVIRGSAVNQDGRSHGLNAPNGPAQVEVIRQALSQAQIDPADVDYLEAHGTGTALGDPVEVQAIDKVYGQAKGRSKALVMGAVKANIGHCESAAGIAGLIKSIQIIQDDELPPIAHLEKLNPHFNGLSEYLEFPTVFLKERTNLPTWHSDQSRIAAVSSFGYTGTNVHMIVTQYAAEKERIEAGSDSEAGGDQSTVIYPFYFSAHTASSLRHQLLQCHELVESTPNISLALLSESVNRIRNHFTYRFGCQAATTQELLSCLSVGAQETYQDSTKRPAIVLNFGPSTAQYTISAQELEQNSWVSRLRKLDVSISQETELSLEVLVMSEQYPTLKYMLSQLSCAERLVTEGAELRKIQAVGTGIIAALVVAEVITFEDAARLCVSFDKVDTVDKRKVSEAEIRQLISDLHLVEAQCQVYVECRHITKTNQSDNWIEWPYSRISEAKGLLLELLNHQQQLHQFHWPILDTEIGIEVPELQLFPRIPGEKTHNTEQSEVWINVRTNLFNRGASLRWNQGTRGQNKAQHLLLPDYTFDHRRYWLPEHVTKRVSALPFMFSSVRHSIFTTLLAEPNGGSLYAGELSLAQLPFLRDHLVAGNIVLPASVYLNMIAEVCPCFDGLPANIVQMQIRQACTLGSEPIGVYCRVEQSDDDMASVEIYTISDLGVWTKHVTAQVNLGKQPAASIHSLVAERDLCPHAVSVERHLARARQAGIEYGESFQAIRQLYHGSGVALGRIEWPSVLQDYWSGGSLHPVMLDACFQVISAAMDMGDDEKTPLLFVPTEIHDMKFQAYHSDILWCFIRILAPEATFRSVESMYDYLTQQEKISVSLHVYDDHGQAIFSIERFEASRYRPMLDNAAWKDWLLEKQWVALPSAVERLNLSASLLLAEARPQFGAASYTMSADIIQDFDALSGHFIHNTLAELGLSEQLFDALLTHDEGSEFGSVLEQLGILPSYERLLQRLVTLSQLLIPPERPIHDIEAQLRTKLGEETHELDLLMRCGNALTDVLRGKTKAVDLLFEAENSQVTEALYQDSPGTLALNHRIAALVSEAASRLPSGRQLRILEVGAGTGSTTQQVLKQINGQNITYTFTDISTHFLTRAKEKFCEYEESMSFRLFDLQQDPIAQGFAPGEFDLVIAVNVLHATADLTRTLKHLSQCMVDGGVLLLREVTEQQAWLDLSFGMTPGWWSYTDTSLRVKGPLLDTEGWQALLSDSGFHSLLATDESGRTESVFVAEKNPDTTDLAVTSPEGCYLILVDEDADDMQWLKSLKHELEQRGVVLVTISHELIYAHDSQESEVFSSLLMAAEDKHGPIIGLVYAWSMTSADLRCDETLGLSEIELYLKYPLLLCQTLLHPRWRHISPSFLTTGAQPLGNKVTQPLQAMIWGHVFTYINENATFARLIDLDDSCVSGERLYAALMQREECQLVVRDGQLHAARLRRATLAVSEEQENFTKIVGDGSYVITGGLGDLGLQTAKKLAEQGAKHLILIGRRERKDAEKTLNELQAQGVTVVPLYVDVSDASALDIALKKALVSLPEIRGVVHSVGVLDDGVIEKQNWERYLNVLRPKVFGAINLYHSVAGYDLDFFVIYSSAAAVMGNPGQANHAAANAFLDAFAWYLRGEGYPGLSIGWGAWSEIGAAAARDITTRLSRNQSIAGTIPPEQGVALIAKQFNCSNVQFTVLPIDYERQIDSQQLPHTQRLLSELLAEKSAIQKSLQESDVRESVNTDNFLQRLQQMNAAERQRQIETYLQEVAVKLLKLQGTIERQTSLFESGLDSLLAIDLRSLLEKRFVQKFESTLLYDYPTIEALTDYLLKRVPENHSNPDESLANSPQSFLNEPAKSAVKNEYQDNGVIAVVGMSCRFPGGANSIGEYWEILKNGVDTVQPIPAERWDHTRYYDPDRTTPGKIYIAEGCFIDQVDQFCPERFGIAGIEADLMDPQQRLLLDVCFEALESAGQDPMALSGSETGVFMGVMTQDYLHLTQNVREHAFYVGTGSANSVVAGRISHVFGLMGPSMTLDTACSSSLVGVQTACTHLRSGACDMAIAGGVSLQLSPEPLVIECAGGMLSPSGRCRTFDASADGFVRGEGCGVVVLKRLVDAERDRDPIIGVIRGGAITHDGRAGGLTVPNGLSQQKVLEKAMHDAQLSPSDISYIEAHGTGTHLGDPLELNALQSVFNASQDKTPLYVGSVKTNIGHTEAAAGVAGLIKVLLCLQHEKLVPHLHFKQPNPNFDWDFSNIQVTDSLLEWTSTTIRRAGVSSFGLSGTNAHLIVEEYKNSATVQKRPSGFVPLVVLSHISQEQLQLDATRYHQLLAEHAPSVIDAAYTFCMSRSGQRAQAIFPAKTQDELLDGLKKLANGELVISDKSTERPRLSWHLTVTQCPVWFKHASAYYDLYEVFRQVIDEGVEVLHICGFDEVSSSDLCLVENVIIPVQIRSAILTLAYGRLLLSLGIEPESIRVVGLGGLMCAAALGGVSDMTAMISGLFAENERELTSVLSSINFSHSHMHIIFEADDNTPDVLNQLCASACNNLLQKGTYAVVSNDREIVLDLVRSKVNKNKFTELYQLLTTLSYQGLNIDWHTYYIPASPRRVALPCSHFPTRRYWVNDQTAISSSDDVPLICHDITSARDGSRYIDYSLDVEHQAFLAEHCLGRIRTLPAAGSLAFVIHALKAQNSISLNGVRFVRPAQFENRLSVQLSVQHENRAQLFYCQAPNEQWLLFTDVESIVVGQKAVEMSSTTDFDALLSTLHSVRDEASFSINKDTFYSKYIPRELNLGPSYQRIESMCREGLSLVTQIRNVSSDFDIDPRVLDACMQSVNGLADSLDIESNGLFIPYTIKRVSILSWPVGTYFWCVAQFLTESSHANELVYDITIVDEQDRVCACFEHVTFRKTEAMSEDERAISDTSVIHKLKWQHSPLPASMSVNEVPMDTSELLQNVLIIGDAMSLRSLIQNDLEDESLKTVHAAVAGRTVEELCAVIDECSGADVLIYTALLDKSYPEHLATEELTHDLWRLKQWLVAAGKQSKPFIVLTASGQCVYKDEIASSAVGFAAAALIQTAAQEFPSLPVVLVDIDDLTIEQNGLAWLNEIKASMSDTVVAYRDGKRYLRELEVAYTLQEVLHHELATPVRTDRTYLITGGLGEVGLLTAEKLVSEGANALVLMSRSEHSDTQKRVAALREAGCQVEVLFGDITDIDVLKKHMHKIETCMPPLAGIFHAAAISANALMKHQSEMDWTSVVEVKVKGALNLFEVSRDMTLDCFVLFSSIASVGGSIGQANYAIANSVLDYLAQHWSQQGTPVMSVNWGAWENTGMAGRAESRGVEFQQCLTAQQALSSLCFLMRNPISQAICFRAEKTEDVSHWGRIEKDEGHSPNDNNRFIALGHGFFNLSEVEQSDTVAQCIRSILSDFLKIDVSQIKDERPFFDFGMDSITAVDFSNRLGEALELDLHVDIIFDYPSLLSLTGYVLQRLYG